jgi:hypothetical protein
LETGCGTQRVVVIGLEQRDALSIFEGKIRGLHAWPPSAGLQ